MHKFVVLLFVLVLFASTVAPFSSVKANPYGFTFPTSTSPPDSVHLTITIASPKENASYSTGTINVRFDETINSPDGISTSVNIISTYQGDWMNDSRWCPFPPGVDRFKNQYTFLQHNFDITDIPVGAHTLNITAQGQGGFNENNTQYSFTFQKIVSIKFSIVSSNQSSGTSTPTVTIPSSAAPNPEFLVVPSVIASVIAIVLAAAGLLVYNKKRRTALEHTIER